jgi:membrane protein required for colicin V production
VDVVIVLVFVAIAGFAIWGYRVGLVRRVVEFCGLIVSFLLACQYAPRGAALLTDNSDLQPKAALIIAWIVIMLLGLLATRLVAWAVSKTVRISIIGWLDRVGGAVFGLLTGTVLISALLVAASLLPGGETISKAFNARPVPRIVYNAAPALYVALQGLGVDAERALKQLYEEAHKRAAESELVVQPAEPGGFTAAQR